MEWHPRLKTYNLWLLENHSKRNLLLSPEYSFEHWEVSGLHDSAYSPSKWNERLAFDLYAWGIGAAQICEWGQLPNPRWRYYAIPTGSIP